MTTKRKKSLKKEMEKESTESFTCILCNNVTENKIYIFSQNGVLLKKIFTEKLIEKFGQID